jgi:hypothetical protein
VSALWLAATLALVSCSRGLGRPLTPLEKKVVLADGGQRMSVRLAGRCEPVGMEEMDDVTVPEIKARAVERGGNVAQILFDTETSSAVTSDVRFWKCPE